MKVKEFAALVRGMRLAQQGYFTARRCGQEAPELLRQSKELERQVDDACRCVLAGDSQMELFSEA